MVYNHPSDVTALRTTRNLRIPVLLSAVVLLAASACQPNHERDESTAPPRVVSGSHPAAEPGREAVTAHYAMSVKSSRACTVEPHLAPPKGVKKFSVEVEIRALGEAEVPANPFYATLATIEGEHFESTLAGCRPLLTAQRITKPTSARGWVTFDIPEAAQPASLIYRPIIIGAGSEKVELLLGP